jgi:hypothetical protein
MASNTPARPWTFWPADELHGDFNTAEDQATTAHGTWLGGRQYAKDQMEARAS